MCSAQQAFPFALQYGWLHKWKIICILKCFYLCLLQYNLAYALLIYGELIFINQFLFF
jgi:hypothetical protein